MNKIQKITDVQRIGENTLLKTDSDLQVEVLLPYESFQHLVQIKMSKPFDTIIEEQYIELCVHPLIMKQSLWIRIQERLLNDSLFINEVEKYPEIMTLINSDYEKLITLPKLIYGGRIESGLIYTTAQLDFKQINSQEDTYFHCFSNKDFIIRTDVNLKEKSDNVGLLIQENNGHYVYPRHVNEQIKRKKLNQRLN